MLNLSGWSKIPLVARLVFSNCLFRAIVQLQFRLVMQIASTRCSPRGGGTGGGGGGGGGGKGGKRPPPKDI